MTSLKEVATDWREKVSDAESDFGIVAKSSVKLIKNSRGMGWEIKVVAGEEGLIEGLKEIALIVHREIEGEFVIQKEVEG